MVLLPFWCLIMIVLVILLSALIIVTFLWDRRDYRRLSERWNADTSERETRRG